MTFQRLGAMTSRFVFGAALAAAVAGSALIMPTVARAHEVWLEADGAGTTLYFGEFGDNLHEASPGYLDKLTQLTASVVSAKGEKLLRAKRLPDGIAFAGRAVSGESVVAVDAAYPLIEGKEGDKPVRTAWTPAARHVPELRSYPFKAHAGRGAGERLGAVSGDLSRSASPQRRGAPDSGVRLGVGRQDG